MYSIHAFGKMIGDKVRTDAYYAALQTVIQPDSIVIDIGAGTGILSMLAVQLGAKHVYAIEPSDAIEVGRELAVANGMAERITFIQDVSTEVTLPEAADVIVSDLRGTLPIFGEHIPSIIDARTRLLAPEGILIPQKDTVWVALVSSAEEYENTTAPWKDNNYGLSLDVSQFYLQNTWRSQRVDPQSLCVGPQVWAELDYTQLETATLAGSVSWPVQDGMTVHGFTLWFEATLAENIGFSTDPREPALVYGSAFFPLQEPLNLTNGDKVTMEISANPVGSDYIWRWETKVTNHTNPNVPRIHWKQSSFLGRPFSLDRLKKRDIAFTPSLDEAGNTQSAILALMDGQHTNAQIAGLVYEQHPAQFGDERDALERVRELSSQFAEDHEPS